MEVVWCCCADFGWIERGEETVLMWDCCWCCALEPLLAELEDQTVCAVAATAVEVVVIEGADLGIAECARKAARKLDKKGRFEVMVGSGLTAQPYYREYCLSFAV